MAGILFTNFARSQLAAPLLVGDLSLTVETGHGARFPSPGASEYFYLVLENAALDREIVKCTSRSVDTLTIVRAQDNTTALGWNAGDTVALRFVAAAIADAVTGTAMLTGADFTGAVSMAALLTANGGVEVPVDATGNSARRANQLIWNVGGAAALPTWATAGRPATPADGYSGFNTDLDQSEVWSDAISAWKPTGISAGVTVALAGTGVDMVDIIPPLARRVTIIHVFSFTGANSLVVRLGTASGFETAAYKASTGVFGSTNIAASIGYDAGFPVYSAAGANNPRGTLVLDRIDGTNTWACRGTHTYAATGWCGITSGEITLPGALTSLRFVSNGADSFDGTSSATVSWEF